MKSLTKKQSQSSCCAPKAPKAQRTAKVSEAQCCAKRSRVVAGCHD